MFTKHSPNCDEPVQEGDGVMEIRLPKLGEGADSGSVVNVYVKEGDVVKKDQTLIELENEKAVAAIPSTAAGRVTKVHVRQGDKISVGQPIVSLEGANGAEPQAAAPAAAPRAQKPAAPAARTAAAEPVDDAPLPEPPAGGPPPAAAPSVRKIAQELGIDLRRVRGSERGGRIVLADLKAYIQRLEQLASRGGMGGGARPAVLPESIDFSKWGPVTKQPLSSLRQTIAQRMTASWTTIPHVTQFDEADITGLLQLKKKYDAAYDKQGAKLTVTTFIVNAVARLLKTHPTFNASLDEVSNELVLKQYVHIGIAVDTEAGLMVPVIRNADRKSLAELAKELNSLAERTRQRKVTAEEMQGGTFTISNQGGIGGAHFTPIIKKPEVAILGVGQGRMKPVVPPGMAGATIGKTLVPLGLSYDHRVVDGADAARFITELVKSLEAFDEQLVKL